MKNIDFTGIALLLGGVAVLTAGFYIFAKRKEVGVAVEKAVQAVNPLSTENLAYKAANAVTRHVTGDTKQTFGGWLHDTFSPSAKKVEEMLSIQSPTMPYPADVQKNIAPTQYPSTWSGAGASRQFPAIWH